MAHTAYPQDSIDANPPSQQHNLPLTLDLTLINFCISYAHNHQGRIARHQLITLDKKLTGWHLKLTEPLETFIHLLTCNHSAHSIRLQQQLGDCLQETHSQSIEIKEEFIKNTFALTKTIKRTPLQAIKDACANLTNYLKIKKATINPEDYELLILLLQDHFKHSSKVTLNQQLKNRLAQAKISTFDSFQLTFDDL